MSEQATVTVSRLPADSPWAWVEDTLCELGDAVFEHSRNAWQVAHESGPATVFTNGKAMLVVPGELGAPAASEKLQGNVTGVLAANRGDGPGIRFRLADLQRFLDVPTDYPAVCPQCNGVGNDGECGKCSGRGSYSCTCLTCDDEHDADCDECDGNGVYLCGTCKVDIYVRSIARIALGAGVYNANLIRPLAWRLRADEVTWWETKLKSGAGFTTGLIVADSWTLVLMPIRHEKGQPEPKVFAPLAESVSTRSGREDGSE